MFTCSHLAISILSKGLAASHEFVRVKELEKTLKVSSGETIPGYVTKFRRIVDDGNRACAGLCQARLPIGKIATTRVPSPGCDSTTSLPPAISARSAIASKPSAWQDWWGLKPQPSSSTVK